MAKINRKDLAARVQSSGAGAGIDRFEQAAVKLSEQPTGFSEPLVSRTLPYMPATDANESYQVVPVDLIDFNPFNARRIYTEEQTKTLAVSLAANGQEVPGSATIRNGRYILAAGHYRLRGLRLAGIPTMKLMVRHGMTDKDLYRISFLENDDRSGQSALDNALAWSDLLQQGVFKSETELSEATNKSLPTVNKTLTLLNLSAPVLELVTSDPSAFGMSVLYELLQLEKVAGANVTLETANSIQKGDASRRTIMDLRERYSHPKERKKKENSRQNFKIVVEGVQVGAIKEWDDGRVLLDIVLKEQNLRAELMADLRRRFHIDIET